MDFAAILGFGAIGLGFLLAGFAYRLLARNIAKERPVYVYMGFCVVLVGIGASLQYNESQYKERYERKMLEYENLSKQFEKSVFELTSSQQLVTKLQSSLFSQSEMLSGVKSTLNEAEGRNAQMEAGMRAIVSTLSPSSPQLQKANQLVTYGGACNGNGGGTPMPHGADAATLITDALSEISAALTTANQYASKK